METIARIIVIAVIAALTCVVGQLGPGVSGATLAALGVALATFCAHAGRGAWGRALVASGLAALGALVLSRYGLSVLLFAYPELGTVRSQAWQVGLLVAWLGALGLFDRASVSARAA